MSKVSIKYTTDQIIIDFVPTDDWEKEGKRRNEI